MSTKTSTVPGIKAAHMIISDNCRTVQGGDMKAFDVAVRKLRKEYENLMDVWPKGKGAEFSVILTVDYP